MPERYLGQLKPDMDVCDVTGKKVGTISHVYRYADAAIAVSPATSPAPLGQWLPSDELMEVKTGFLGLGSHLFIPISAVQEILNDCVFVSKSQAAFEGLGWHDKPAYFDQLQ
jgi:hypothetical protein